jgi:hypothetical protein
MKRFPRLLPLLALSLVAFIWSGGSEVGVAMHDGVITHERLAPPAAQILSFTATPPVIRPGEEVILR